MPRFTKDGRTVETSAPRDIVNLRASGWKEEKSRTTAVRQADAAQAATVEKKG